jgi:hypothetical protein
MMALFSAFSFVTGVREHGARPSPSRLSGRSETTRDQFRSGKHEFAIGREALEKVALTVDPPLLSLRTIHFAVLIQIEHVNLALNDSG